MKTLLTFLLFPFFLSAQTPKLWQNIKYEWNKEKTIGLTTLILASLADGIVEGYEFDQRKAFEVKYGVSPVSFAGSESWRRAYKNGDPSQGHANWYSKNFGAFDLYHLMDDIRKFGYISGGVFITIGAKNQNLKGILIDAATYTVASSISKTIGMNWVRSPMKK